MSFREITLHETSMASLYRSTVRAFPETTKRQYATDPVEVSRIRWTPFLGLKTLYVRALAQNEGREYETAIVFKGVKYHAEDDARGLVAVNTEGKRYLLEPLTEDAEVLVRCSCPDWNWRFKHFNFIDRSIQGPDGKKYEAKFNPGSANPLEIPGMCKHMLKLIRTLTESGLLLA